MSDKEETLLEFPCPFALKVMVLAEAGVKDAMLDIVNEHIEGEVSRKDTSERPSRTGKYTALTITFTATSKAQLDDIYMAMSKHDKVRMAL